MDPFSLSLMAGSMAQGGLQLFSAFQDAARRKLQGRYQKEALDFNADVADFGAEQAIKRGAEEAGEIRRAGSQVKGSQRAALAAQGVDVDTGTAADLQAETEQITQSDMRTATNNAWLESWGLRADAQKSRHAGRMAEMGANADANATLLAGGLQAAGSFLKSADYARGGLSLGYQKKTAGVAEEVGAAYGAEIGAQSGGIGADIGSSYGRSFGRELPRGKRRSR